MQNTYIMTETGLLKWYLQMAIHGFVLEKYTKPVGEHHLQVYALMSKPASCTKWTFNKRLLSLTRTVKVISLSWFLPALLTSSGTMHGVNTLIRAAASLNHTAPGL
jgi:hypothetical protein